MDERHWWLANKIQETFYLENNEVFRVLEKLFSRNETINIITNFLTNGSGKNIFVYALKDNLKTSFEISDLKITENLVDICNVDFEKIVIRCFWCKNIKVKITQLNIHKYVFSSEIKVKSIQHLATLLSSTILPKLKKETEIFSKTKYNIDKNKNIEKNGWILAEISNDKNLVKRNEVNVNFFI